MALNANKTSHYSRDFTFSLTMRKSARLLHAETSTAQVPNTKKPLYHDTPQYLIP
jgi:hypothetical protein